MVGCDFCTLRITSNGTLKKGKFIFVNDDISIAIHDESDEMIVETDNFNIDIKLNYCPMCGGKLRESEVNNDEQDN